MQTRKIQHGAVTTCQHNCRHLTRPLFPSEPQKHTCRGDAFKSTDEAFIKCLSVFLSSVSPLTHRHLCQLLLLHLQILPWFSPHLSAPTPLCLHHPPSVLPFFLPEEQMGFNSGGNDGWIWTVSYLTGGGCHTLCYMPVCACVCGCRCVCVCPGSTCSLNFMSIIHSFFKIKSPQIRNKILLFSTTLHKTNSNP